MWLKFLYEVNEIESVRVGRLFTYIQNAARFVQRRCFRFQQRRHHKMLLFNHFFMHKAELPRSRYFPSVLSASLHKPFFFPATLLYFLFGVFLKSYARNNIKQWCTCDSREILSTVVVVVVVGRSRRPRRISRNSNFKHGRSVYFFCFCSRLVLNSDPNTHTHKTRQQNDGWIKFLFVLLFLFFSATRSVSFFSLFSFRLCVAVFNAIVSNIHSLQACFGWSLCFYFLFEFRFVSSSCFFFFFLSPFCLHNFVFVSVLFLLLCLWFLLLWVIHCWAVRHDTHRHKWKRRAHEIEVHVNSTLTRKTKKVEKKINEQQIERVASVHSTCLFDYFHYFLMSLCCSLVFFWLLSLSHRCRDALPMHNKNTVTVVIQSLHKTNNSFVSRIWISFGVELTDLNL